MDLRGVYTYISPSIFQLRGYTPEEVLQQKPEELIYPGSLPIVKQRTEEGFKAIMAGIDLGPVVIEVEQPCRDGTTVWTEVVTRVFYDEFGKPAGIIGVSRDISKRRKAEEALRENEKIFHLFSENSPDVQFLWDLKNDKPTYVSPSITRMTGFTVEEVFHSRRDLMMTPQSLAYYLPLQTERNRLFLKDPKKEREYIDELQYYRKDGSTYYAEIYKHYMLDKHGNPLLIGILRDITMALKIIR